MLAIFLQVKVSVVNYAGDSFCWSYATDTFYGNYSSDNVCGIFAGFEVVLSVTGMLMDLSVTIMQVTVSVAIMQLEVSAAHMQVTFSATNMWYFLQCIMHMTVSSNNFIFRSLTASLHKIDQKTFKSVISGLHFTTFVNILPKLRYFASRNDIQIG